MTMNDIMFGLILITVAVVAMMFVVVAPRQGVYLRVSQVMSAAPSSGFEVREPP